MASDLAWAISGCLLIAVLPFLLDRLLTRRRTQLLEQQARKLGFSFQCSADPFTGSDIRGLAALEQDPAALTINVMHGRAGHCQAVVFERAHYSPEMPVPVETTFAAFRCSSGQLPVFEIGERGWAHRLADVVQRKSDLDLGPKCGKLFVHCANAGTTRDFLPTDKLAALHLEAQHFRIESSPDWILIFHPGKRVKPEALPDFVSCTAAIASALLDQVPPPSQQSTG